jgi:tRNA wybutosine-synthesizing protein 1
MHADSPKEIIDGCIQKQRKILQGFKGNENADLKKFHEAMNPSQFAISLTGEATLYPYLSEMIKALKRKKINSFLVSNGLLPDKLKELKIKKALPTQLYISLLYPNEHIFRRITNNHEKFAWKKFNESLKLLKSLSKGTRTVLRLTLIKSLNMIEPETYVKLIKIASPDFIEVKAYMHIGYSQYRLKKEDMPTHKEVKAFAKKIIGLIPGYKMIDEKENSRVVLLSNNKKNKMIPKAL